LFEPRLSGRLWPIHLKPYRDELLSSWLIRLIRAHGGEAYRVCNSLWGHPAFWNRDIDKGIFEDVLEMLAEKTATSPARTLDTTFLGYPGFPEHELYGNGLSPWLLSIGLRGGRRYRPWVQYCPPCLQDDEDPYFRRHWRLTFVTVCQRHCCRLLDRCMACGAPCNFHQLSGDADAITRCYRCRFDARRARAPSLNNTAAHHRHIEFQTFLVEALERGWCALSKSQLTPTVHYLLVLRQLGRLLVTRNRALERRTAFCRHLGEPYFEPCFPSPRARALEVLSVVDRFALMRLLGWWMDDWPDQFVAMCAMANLTMTDLMRDLPYRPLWYEEAVEQVVRGRFSRMKFAYYGDSSQQTPNPVASTSVKSQLLL
jgi:hypothetical protein